jgi:hypothetical protein
VFSLFEIVAFRSEAVKKSRVCGVPPQFRWRDATVTLREKAFCSRSEQRHSLFLEGFDTPDDFHDLTRDLRLASPVVGHR